MQPDQSHFHPGRGGIYLIKITSYVEKSFRGSLLCPHTGQRFHFGSLAQLLLLLQRQMDEANFPQRWMESRAAWSDQEADASSVRSEEADGPCLATFKLSVLFRQNASWQGNVVWCDRNMSSHFRSALELVELMDSALTSQ